MAHGLVLFFVVFAGTCKVAPVLTVPVFDPCLNYTVLDDPWRATNYTSETNHCDSRLSWHGWYRMLYYGQTVRMPQQCVWRGCGTSGQVWMNDTHPQLEDGIVTRKMCVGLHSGDCCQRGSGTPSIRVKACPGDFYVYELIPTSGCYFGFCADMTSLSGNAFTTVAPEERSTAPVFDPCLNYTVLDDPWRATNNTSEHDHCDSKLSWHGWYRMLYYGQTVRMPEQCLFDGCGTTGQVWMNGVHPQIEDGIVTRNMCRSSVSGDCCKRSPAIQVKACPGNFYVYELDPPSGCNFGFCADINSLSGNGISTAAPEERPTVTPVLTAPVFDPCLNYTVLDDPWRATNYTSETTHCDSRATWHGWYRLLYHKQTVQIPERCVNRGCGTSGRVWMNGTHPRLEDGIVTRKMCKALGTGECCYDMAPSIQVKACPGGFYVYELVPPNGCNYAYCADMNSLSGSVPTTAAPEEIPTARTPSSCGEQHCMEHEVCGEVHGIHGCLCNKSHHQPNPESFGLSAMCHNSSGWISLSRCQLFEAGFPAEILHLNDPDCRGTISGGRVEFTFNNDDKRCGTFLKANETHVIYENSIQGKMDSADGHIISRQRLLNLQFACEYPAEKSVSMDMAIHALSSIVRLNLPAGHGSYQVQMTPYKDPVLTQLFSGSVSGSLDKQIYIAVDVEGVDQRQLSSVLDSCWATPTNDSNSAVNWDLLTNSCPNPEDGTVEVLRNGESTKSVFSFRIFSFDGYPPQVYVHCSLHLCVREENNCIPSCNSANQPRQQRSADRDQLMVSCGPLTFPPEETDVVAALNPVPERHSTKF